jgi:hypothetical protein
MKAKLGLVVCLALASAQACGGKSDSEKFAESYCAEVAKCCGLASLPTDGKACRELFVLAGMGGSYNSQAGNACLAEVKSQASAGTFCTSLDSSAASACDSVYGSSSGSKKPGETCDFDSDCATSSDGKVVCASVYVNSNFISKCQVQVPGKAGDTPCVGTQDGNVFRSYSDSNATDVASRGYVCNLADGIQCRLGTCAALVAAGGTCGLSSDCVRSAFCNFSTDLCATRVAAGGTCTGSDSSECVDGYYCTSSSKQCTAKVANGGSCTTSSMCQSDYCLNSVCADDNSGLSLICGSN